MAEKDTGESAASCSVAVVIPTFNHAHFLGDALDSVMAQTRRVDEIVVVDDGSSDNPAAVVARYPGVRLVRQENAGLAAARNTGLAAATADYVAFLDADDLLCPGAIARNLELFAAARQAGFVYGAYERIDAGKRPLSGPCYLAIGDDPFATFLEGNAVGMHATVLYARAKLQAIGGFDPGLRVCEDYDVYLRMAQCYPVASHDQVVALYRIHDLNMSADLSRMIRGVLAVHRRYKPSNARHAYLSRWKTGRRYWKRFYADVAIEGRWGASGAGRIRAIVKAMRYAPGRVLQRAGLAAARRAWRPIAGLLGRTPPGKSD